MSTPPRLFSTPLELQQRSARTTILGGLSPEPVPHTALLARAVGLSPEPVRALPGQRRAGQEGRRAVLHQPEHSTQRTPLIATHHGPPMCRPVMQCDAMQ